MDRYFELRKSGIIGAWHLVECSRYEDEELDTDEHLTIYLTILRTHDMIKLSAMIDKELNAK